MWLSATTRLLIPSWYTARLCPLNFANSLRKSDMFVTLVSNGRLVERQEQCPRPRFFKEWCRT